MALPDPPLIQLHFISSGYKAECKCGDHFPTYRVSLGKYLRFACETCLIDILLAGMPVEAHDE